MAFFSSRVTPHTALCSSNSEGICAGFMFARGSTFASYLSDYVKFLEIFLEIFYAFVKESIF